MTASPKPYTIIVIGPAAPLPREGFQTKIIPVSSANDALCLLRPMLWIPVAPELCPGGGIPLAPERMKDLTPDGIVQSVKYLKDLDAARDFIRRTGAEPAHIAQAIREKWPGLPLDLSYQEGPAEKTPESRVDDILSMVAMGGAQSSPVTGNDANSPKAWALAIDKLLSDIITIIFSNQAFRDLERTWRGIDLIVRQGPAGESKATRLAIVNAAFENLPEVLSDLGARWENDPPDLVIIEHPFDNSPVSMEGISGAASFAENLLVPTIIDISARFLGIGDWEGIAHLPYLSHHIEDNPIYAGWTRLRSLPECNWLCGACNPFLVRSAYRKEDPGQSISFDEPDLLYISPVFAVATLAAQSVSACGWPSRLTDNANVCLEGLGLHSSGGGTTQASTEIIFSVDRLRQAGEIGLTPLEGALMRDIAFLPEARVVSGEPLAFQMLFSRLTGFLIRLREEYGGSIATEDAASKLAEALDMFFRLSGGHIPSDLSVQENDGNQNRSFGIEFTPPAAIIAGSRRVSFTFSW